MAAAVSLVSSVNLSCIAFTVVIFVSALKGAFEWEGLSFHSVPQTNCCGDTTEEIREALPRASYSPLQTHTGPIMPRECGVSILTKAHTLQLLGKLLEGRWQRVSYVRVQGSTTRCDFPSCLCGSVLAEGN